MNKQGEEWLNMVKGVLGEKRFNEYIKSAQRSATFHARNEPVKRYIFKDGEHIEEAEFEEIASA